MCPPKVLTGGKISGRVELQQWAMSPDFRIWLKPKIEFMNSNDLPRFLKVFGIFSSTKIASNFGMTKSDDATGTYV